MLEVPQLVIIDLDDTLYDYSIANRAGEKALNEFIASVLNQSSNDIAAELSKARITLKSRLGEVAASHSRLLYVREFLNSEHIQIHASFALECEQVFWREYLLSSSLFPGVIEFLTYLRLRKTQLVLVTDLTTSIQLRKLAWFGLDKIFDLVLTSEEAGGDKISGLPEDLLHKLLVPTPERIWSIGDKDWDHLYKGNSAFFRKVSTGRFRLVAPDNYEFESYTDLLNQIAD
jgi:FMN phosphatase YigB (HAD superfamily)